MSEASAGDERTDEDPEAGTSGIADADVWRALSVGATGLLALLAVVATIQLYTNASAAISRWIAPEYVAAFQAVFNLVVLLLALAGLAWLARRRSS